jgi:copper transport protein
VSAIDEHRVIRRFRVAAAACRALMLGAALAACAPVLARALPASPSATFFHATLRSSSPAAGSTLDRAPDRIRLVFSEEIEPSLGSIRLIDASGRATRLAVAGDPRDVTALVASAPAGMANGTYRVEWRIVSEDGHPMDGSFEFTIAASGGATAPSAASPSAPTRIPETTAVLAPSAPAAPTATQNSSALEGALVLPAVLRGLGMGTIAALAGLLGFLATRRDAAPEPRAERLTTRLAIAAAGLLVLHFVAWAIHVVPDGALGGDQLAALLSSDVARVELARTGLALLAAWALLLARRPRLALGFAVATLLVSGAAGHSAAIHPEWAVPARALHLVAVAAWLGGLLWLIVLERRSAVGVTREAQRVSSVALAAVITVAFSGVVQTRLFLPVWSDLVRSTYGVITLAKVTGLGVLVLFGAHHRYRVLPRLADTDAPEELARSLRKEVAVMSIVILLGGLLSYVAPPNH